MRFSAGPQLRHGGLRRRVRATLLLVAAALVAASCGGSDGAPTPTVSGSPSSSPPVATATPTTSARIECPDVRGGTSARARISDLRIATAAGHDTLVIQFDAAVPQYSLTPNPDGTTFAGGGGKGGTFTLAGSYGLRLEVSNLNWTVAPGNQYPHGTDLTQPAPALLEVRQIGDYEGIVNIAIGLTGQICPTVTSLAGPPRLVLDFPTG